MTHCTVYASTPIKSSHNRKATSDNKSQTNKQRNCSASDFFENYAYVGPRVISLSYFNTEAPYEKGLDLLSKLTPVQYSIYVSMPCAPYHKHMRGEGDFFISAVPVELGAAAIEGSHVLVDNLGKYLLRRRLD